MSVATDFHRSLITTVRLYREAVERGDEQAARYYSVAIRGLLGPSKARGILKSDDES